MTAAFGGRDGVWSARVELPPAPTSPRAARALLRIALQEWGVGELEDLDLLLTEVVTNAVVHAGTPFVVLVTGRPGWARVEVHDGSPGKPQQRQATVRSEHGRGMLLLDHLASAWGWEDGDEQAGARKFVWFELSAGLVSRGGTDRTAAVTAAFDAEQ